MAKKKKIEIEKDEYGETKPFYDKVIKANILMDLLTAKSKIRAATALISSASSITSCSVISSPCTWILSVKLTRCGDVKSPTLKPACFKIDTIRADVEPFPFVPLTWIERYEVWG